MSSGDRSSGKDFTAETQRRRGGDCSAALRPHPSCAVDRFRAMYPMSSGTGSPARLCSTSGSITRRRRAAGKAGSRHSSEETSKRETEKTTLRIAADPSRIPVDFPPRDARGDAFHAALESDGPGSPVVRYTMSKIACLPTRDDLIIGTKQKHVNQKSGRLI